jgi:glycosyltransferase involved in cell wall biosynthesis
MRVSNLPEKKPKILFYNDSHVFGGHEFMTSQIANELNLQRRYAVSFIYFNDTFSRLLNVGIKKWRISFQTKLPLPFLRNLNVFHILKLTALIKKIKPDLFVVSQGDIEIGLKGLFSGILCKIPTVSYVPMAFSFKERQKFLGGLRDLIDGIYYKIPHEFITISDYQATLLKRFINRKTIHVIRLPVSKKQIPEPVEVACRPTSRGALNIGVIGRIEFNQKNQGILIDVSNILKKSKSHFTFHVIGDGPDRARLEKRIGANHLKEHFVLYGWLDRDELFRHMARDIDIVLIPSNYEGLPLVLLESLYLNKAFLISNLNTLKEYAFPKRFLIDQHNPEDIAAKLLALKNSFHEADFIRIQKDVVDKHSAKRFKEDVASTFDRLSRRLS